MDIQKLIVTVIVGLAIAYALWRFMPAALKRSLIAPLSGMGRGMGLSETRVRQMAQKLESSGACGSCDSCKACATPVEHAGRPLHLHK